MPHFVARPSGSKQNECYTNNLQCTVCINGVDGISLFNSQIQQAATQAEKNSKKNIRFMRFFKKKPCPRLK